MSPIKIIINVLDDEEHILDLIHDMLQGYDVSCFTKPEDFYEAFNKEVDLVITDVRVKQGFDVLSTIKTINTINPSCYLIVMSAYFDVPLMQELIRLRVNDTVTKTHDLSWLSELKQAVDRLHYKLRDRAEINQLLRK